MRHKSTGRSIEIELGANELGSLARSFDDEMSRAALYGYMPIAPAQAARVAQSAGAPRYSISVRGVGILTTAVIAGIAVAAHYEFSGSATQPEPVAWTPLPERPPELEAEEDALPPPPPTRFVNPFDKTEVFELPAGLTSEEARQMVAEILLERARERMR
jgi:hypothetical protein